MSPHALVAASDLSETLACLQLAASHNFDKRATPSPSERRKSEATPTSSSMWHEQIGVASLGGSMVDQRIKEDDYSLAVQDSSSQPVSYRNSWPISRARYMQLGTGGTRA